MSTQFLSVLSTRFLRGFLTERDLRHFCTETRSFLEKSLDSFLCTWNMSTRFLNSEKIWVLVSYKAVSYKKKMCIQVYIYSFLYDSGVSIKVAYKSEGYDNSNARS